jgi:hypothetical protein
MDTVPVWLPYDGVASDPTESLHINGDAIYDPRPSRHGWVAGDFLARLSPEELVSAGPRHRDGPVYDAPRLRDLLHHDTLPVATDQARLRELLAETQSVSRDTELMRETEAYLGRRVIRHRRRRRPAGRLAARIYGDERGDASDADSGDEDPAV